MQKSVEAVEERLADLASSFRLDGYELEVREADPALTIRINALEGACEDCLAPPAIITGLISAALEGAYQPMEITVEYPEGSAAAAH
jgi:Fe-S cluster biogenesis protein NfuA